MGAFGGRNGIYVAHFAGYRAANQRQGLPKNCCISLNINYRSYTIKDVSNHVTLDGELMNAYAGSALLNDKIQFTEWPTLRRGTNTIEWIGNVRSLYIAPNRRTL